jgi:hypothetical protein
LASSPHLEQPHDICVERIPRDGTVLLDGNSPAAAWTEQMD